MNQPSALSVVIVIGADRRRVAVMLRALQRQTAASRLEIVLVDLAHGAGPPGTAPGCAGLAVVTPAEGSGWGEAIAAGFAQASAPCIALLEDHCLPEPDWAAHVIEAHAGGLAAVGYAFLNGSPDRWLYRSILMAEYGFWAAPAVAHSPVGLPGNNLSYSRAALVSLGDGIERRLADGGVVLEGLRQAGYTIAVAPGARVAHQSAALPDVLSGHYAIARLSAHERYRSDSALRRFCVALAAPIAFPALQVTRLAKSLRGRAGRGRALLAGLPVVLAVYLAAAAGISAGCLFGRGASRSSFERVQLDVPRIGENDRG